VEKNNRFYRQLPVLNAAGTNWSAPGKQAFDVSAATAKHQLWVKNRDMVN